MPIIELKTHIKANRAIVFDLSRSIDLHKISTEQTNEEAIAGHYRIGRARRVSHLGSKALWSVSAANFKSNGLRKTYFFCG